MSKQKQFFFIFFTTNRIYADNQYFFRHNKLTDKTEKLKIIYIFFIYLKTFEKPEKKH